MCLEQVVILCDLPLQELQNNLHVNGCILFEIYLLETCMRALLDERGKIFIFGKSYTPLSSTKYKMGLEGGRGLG